jgi:hypothetical protein
MADHTLPGLPAVRNLIAGDPDLLRGLVEQTVNALLSADADALCGADWGERSPERSNRRNGYRERRWDTRAGTIDLRIPKLREGSYFPDWLLERRRRPEKALISVVAEVYEDLMQTTARDLRRTTRRRQRLAIVAIALALVAISGATAIANGWILDDGATFSQADQVQQAPPTSVEFATEIRIGQLTNPVEQPGQLVIPPGSVYAGTLIRRADGDAGHTCVRALAGGGCGVLSPAQPIMGGVISFGASKTLPPLAYGAVAPGVTSVTITCLTGTFQATLIDRRVYEAILTFGTDTGRCSATSN